MVQIDPIKVTRIDINEIESQDRWLISELVSIGRYTIMHVIGKFIRSLLTVKQ